MDEKDEDVIEIDWMDLLRRTWACRRVLLKALGAGFLVGCIVAFSMPRQYTVGVTLAPESGQTGGNLSGLASMVGLGSVGMEGEDALGAALSADIVGSTPFLLEMFGVRVPTEDGQADTTLAAYLDEQRRPWWGYVAALPGQMVGAVKLLFADEEAAGDTLDPFRLTKKQAAKVELLRKNIVADVDKKTGKTAIPSRCKTLWWRPRWLIVWLQGCRNTSSTIAAARRRLTATIWKSFSMSVSRSIMKHSNAMRLM